MRIKWPVKKKEMKKEPPLIFFPGDWTETTEYLKNPGRGWYEIYTFQAEKKPDTEELKWCLREEETLALVLVDIGAYRSCVLDKEALENIRELLTFFLAHEKDVILRLVYDREGKGMEREPALFSQVLSHLRQIGQLLQESRHSVFLYQGLLVGSWGEMHHSKFLAEDKIQRMWEEIRSFLSDHIFLAVRKPAYFRILNEEQEEKTWKKGQIQTCLFDDGIFGSETHLGTFGTADRASAGWKKSWNRKEELAFEENVCRFVPNGGEAVRGEKRSLPEMVRELSRTHITYLNCVHDEERIQEWKNLRWEEEGVWKGKSGYDYIGGHLGYRFVIRNVCISFSETVENFCEINLIVENTGFAGIYQETELFLIHEGEAKEQKAAAIECDMRDWESGAVHTVSVRIASEPGKLYLACRRKKDKRIIYFASRHTDGRVYLGRLVKKPSISK